MEGRCFLSDHLLSSDFFQALYGMSDGTPYKKQYEKNLEKAVASGSMSVVDYYERKTEFKQATAKGVDDGSSCTRGILPKN